MGIKVSDVMTRTVVFAPKEATVRDISSLMRDRGISSVVISDEGQTAGIVTEHDIVSKVVSTGIDPLKTLAADVMSHPVMTVDFESDLEEAARIMRDRRIKRLVAVGEGRVQGIITSFDILVAEPIIRLIAERGI
jgi:CBS domain-containing protein